MTKKTMMPTSEKLIKTPPGPASLNAFPDPTSKPGPIMPRTDQHMCFSAEGSPQTSNSNHLQMSRLQLAMQRRKLATRHIFIFHSPWTRTLVVDLRVILHGGAISRHAPNSSNVFTALVGWYEEGRDGLGSRLILTAGSLGPRLSVRKRGQDFAQAAVPITPSGPLRASRLIRCRLAWQEDSHCVTSRGLS
jgi:hypothetical protein